MPLVLPGCDQLGGTGLAATAVAIANDWALACDLLSGVTCWPISRLYRPAWLLEKVEGVTLVSDRRYLAIESGLEGH